MSHVRTGKVAQSFPVKVQECIMFAYLDARGLCAPDTQLMGKEQEELQLLMQVWL